MLGADACQMIRMRRILCAVVIAAVLAACSSASSGAPGFGTVQPSTTTASRPGIASASASHANGSVDVYLYWTRLLLADTRWIGLSDDQLLVAGTGFCSERGSHDSSTASARAVQMLELEGIEVPTEGVVPVGDADVMSRTVKVTSESFLCPEFNDVARPQRPGAAQPGTPAYELVGSLLDASTSAIDVDTDRIRAPIASEWVFLQSLERDLEFDLIGAEPDRQDVSLRSAYLFCAAADRRGVSTAIEQMFSTFDSEHAVSLVMLAAIYLCPEYFADTPLSG